MNLKILILLLTILHSAFIIGLKAEVFEQTYNFDDYFFNQSGYNVYVHEIEPRCLQITPDGGYAILMEMDLDVQMILFNGVALMKANQFGELEWIKLLSHDSTLSFYETAIADINFGRGFVVNNEGEFVISITNSNNGALGSYLLNLNSEGEYNWIKTIRESIYSGKFDFLSSIKQTSSGEYYAVGRGFYPYNYDLMEVVKFNTQGDTLWTQTYIDENAIASCGYDLEIADDGLPLITGTFDSPSTPEILKIGENGEIIWRTPLNSNFSTNSLISISYVNTENNYYVGYSSSTFLRVDEIDNCGNVINYYEFLRAENYNMFPISLVHTTENVIFTGRTFSDYDVNCIDNNGNIAWQFEKKWYGKGVDVLQKTSDDCFAMISVEGYDNLVLTKFDEEGNYTSIDDNYITKSMNYISNYPNPFKYVSTINFELPQTITNTYIEIFNIKGEKIKTFNCQNQIPIIWDGTNQNHHKVSSGIYLYRMISDGLVLDTKKMMFVK